jgi:uncharacterized protein (DUF1778 family)
MEAREGRDAVAALFTTARPGVSDPVTHAPVNHPSYDRGKAGTYQPLEMSGETPYNKGRKRGFMMPQEPPRTARIEARIAPDALAVVKRAAEIQGRSISDFVVAAAQEAAQRTIEETQIIRLSVEDQRAFADAILNPPPLAPAMERAIDRYRTLVKASVD